jgi:NADPH-dependent 2,4-dienoyl-CoA reductase/sulfur reductase-like enzyme
MASRHIITVGGSDAGISAALRARELDPAAEVTVVVADAYPNFSICGIPYYLSGEVTHWSNLAHRTAADLAATGMRVLTGTRATRVDPDVHALDVFDPTGRTRHLRYDALIVATGAISARPPITGLTGTQRLGPQDGVHLLHSMGDTFAVMDSLTDRNPKTAAIIGGGYIGLEMAEALTLRGIAVTQVEALPEVLPTVDAQLGALIHGELERHGVEVLTDTTVTAITRTDTGALTVTARHHDEILTRTVELILVVVGVRPDTELAADAGVERGIKGAIVVDEAMRTNRPDVFAAGDCVHTHHRLLGLTWLPLGTTAHKQGRVAGENAVGGDARFAGSLGTQVVKVFDLVAARTGLRDHEARTAGRGWAAATSASRPDDHKAYYPGATPIHIRITGDRSTGMLLGAQLVGHRNAEIAKRVDTFAAAIFNGMTIDAISDLDLSYAPPLGSPWDAIQIATQGWVRQYCGASRRQALDDQPIPAFGVAQPLRPAQSLPTTSLPAAHHRPVGVSDPQPTPRSGLA